MSINGLGSLLQYIPSSDWSALFNPSQNTSQLSTVLLNTSQSGSNASFNRGAGIDPLLQALEGGNNGAANTTDPLLALEGGNSSDPSSNDPLLQQTGDGNGTDSSDPLLSLLQKPTDFNTYNALGNMASSPTGKATVSMIG